MQSIVGIVRDAGVARRIATDVHRRVPQARIRILAPESTAEDLAAMPTDDAEQPGMGSAIGAVAGGAAGAAAASILVPPAGAVAILGITAGALLGGWGGKATGQAMEEAATFGLPRDELLVYGKALRDGRSVVIATVEDDDAVEPTRRAMAREDVESIDAARDAWWIGLRDAEAADYGRERFARAESAYRQGFEAACRGEDLASMTPALTGDPAFQAGYARGRAHADAQGRELQ
jgi:hypothetical protein